MGTDKALLRLGNATLLERSLHTLESVARTVVVASGEIGRYHIPGVTFLKDTHPDVGPLGGLLAALEYTKAEALLILACDLPFVSTPLMQLLLTTAPDTPIVIPRSGGIVQPLCGRYAAHLRPSLEAYLAGGGRKVMGFVSTCQHAYLDIDPGHPLFHPSLLSNINLRDDLAQAASIMQQRGPMT
jgi:molybdopterin-guanine dinucleotide biosynthesis protein A